MIQKHSPDGIKFLITTLIALGGLSIGLLLFYLGLLCSECDQDAQKFLIIALFAIIPAGFSTVLLSGINPMFESLLFYPQEQKILDDLRSALLEKKCHIKHFKNNQDFSLVFSSGENVVGIDTCFVSKELLEKSLKVIVMDENKNVTIDNAIEYNKLPFIEIVGNILANHFSEEESNKKHLEIMKVTTSMCENPVYNNVHGSFNQMCQENMFNSTWKIDRLPNKPLSKSNHFITLKIPSGQLVIQREDGEYYFNSDLLENVPNLIKKTLSNDQTIDFVLSSSLEPFFDTYQHNENLKKLEQVNQDFMDGFKGTKTTLKGDSNE